MGVDFDRDALRGVLQRRYPWLALADLGPRSVDAGECDRCGEEPRLVATCGPSTSLALGRRCALALGRDAWCEGHREEADIALAWLADLPAEADDVARLWWVATGEVRLDAIPPSEEPSVASTLALVLAPRDADAPDR